MKNFKYNFFYSLVLLVIAVLACNESDDELDNLDTDCVAHSRDLYPDQATSEYVLPWEVGKSYIVTQGNCTHGSHSVRYGEQYGYDFGMAINTRIHAARGGIVLNVEERFEDGNHTVGEHNFIFIQHADSTVARYIHLTEDGALSEVGDTVQQGELIGFSGNTGYSTGPHLHFDVVDGSCFPSGRDCQTQPVTFRNTAAHPYGLEDQTEYTALPF